MRISTKEKEIIDMNFLFSQLVSMWCDKTGKKQSGLASILGMTPQSISQWKTGTNARRPPWGVLMVLLSATKTSILINENGAKIIKNSDKG
tara:strand:+ start:72259 stop:72531 length:273 start_codon:yes stop_codon:yes gene_type:complete